MRHGRGGIRGSAVSGQFQHGSSLCLPHAELSEAAGGAVAADLCLGAGRVYAVAALFLEAPPAAALAWDAAVCLVMCAVLFWGRGVPLRFFAAACALFVGVSMAMGGMMTALFQLLNRAGLPLEAMGAESEEDGLSAWLFALLAAVSALAGLRGSRLLRRAASRRFARLTVTVDGKTVELQALVDSGNLCRDPISGKPVIFIDPASSRALIGGDGRSPMPLGLARRFRLIPVETVGGKRMQAAYLPDRMTVTDAGGTREIDALFAPAETLEGAGVYRAIVSAELVAF